MGNENEFTRGYVEHVSGDDCESSLRMCGSINVGHVDVGMNSPQSVTVAQLAGACTSNQEVTGSTLRGKGTVQYNALVSDIPHAASINFNKKTNKKT